MRTKIRGASLAGGKREKEDEKNEEKNYLCIRMYMCGPQLARYPLAQWLISVRKPTMPVRRLGCLSNSVPFNNPSSHHSARSSSFCFFNKKMWEGGRYCVATSHEDAGILEASRGSFGFVCVCTTAYRIGWSIAVCCSIIDCCAFLCCCGFFSFRFR